ncbi:MAG: 50S ribosomal protein L17 [Candidatus Omnitrophica bacterium]|nr:50S ribosomal protein L17 [Candidatus Omnitrophota bacterium]
MRHRKKRYRLNKFSSYRRHSIISLTKSLLLHESIRTTKTKAKATQPFFERLITLGKEATIAARRRAFSILNDHKLVKFLFNDISPRFINRQGGYTRILPLGDRRGDGAKLVLFELTERRIIKEKRPKKEKAIQPAQKIEPKKQETPVSKPARIIKPSAGFFPGLRKIFKKERDAL